MLEILLQISNSKILQKILFEELTTETNKSIRRPDHKTEMVKECVELTKITTPNNPRWKIEATLLKEWKLGRSDQDTEGKKSSRAVGKHFSKNQQNY